MDPPVICERQRFQHAEPEYCCHVDVEEPQVLVDELAVDGRKSGHHGCAVQFQWIGMWISDQMNN